MTLEELKELIGHVSVDRKTFVAGVLGGGFYVQIRYYDKDVDTGLEELQTGRKWYSSLSDVPARCVREFEGPR